MARTRTGRVLDMLHTAAKSGITARDLGKEIDVRAYDVTAILKRESVGRHPLAKVIASRRIPGVRGHVDVWACCCPRSHDPLVVADTPAAPESSRLDDDTIASGFAGLAAARAALNPTTTSERRSA